MDEQTEIKKDVLISNVPEELLKKAKKIAKAQDRNFVQVVRELMRDYVAKHEKILEQ